MTDNKYATRCRQNVQRNRTRGNSGLVDKLHQMGEGLRILKCVVSDLFSDSPAGSGELKTGWEWQMRKKIRRIKKRTTRR